MVLTLGQGARFKVCCSTRSGAAPLLVQAIRRTKRDPSLRLGSGGRGHGGAAGEEREQDHGGHGEQDPKVGAGDWQRPLRERRDQRAIETVMRQWAQWGLPPGILSDLSTPSQFSQAAQSVTQDALKGRVVLGPARRSTSRPSSASRRRASTTSTPTRSGQTSRAPSGSTNARSCPRWDASRWARGRDEVDSVVGAHLADQAKPIA